MSKRPMGHGPLKDMRDFKAVAADYEYYLTLSDKPVSVCLTERQMYILSVWNTYTPWMTRWYNTDDTNAAQLALIAAEIEDLLMCGCGVPQPSLTDYLNSITYNNATSTSYETTYNTWNAAGQTVASIAPDLDYGTGDPVDISRVICTALSLLLQTIATSAQATQQGTLDQARDLTKGLTTVFGGLATAGSAGILAGGGAAAVVGFFGGPWLVLGLALAAVGTGIATIIQGASPAAFTDPAALADVLCVMQKNTYNKNMTQAVFQGALTPNTLTGPAAEFATVVQAYLNDQTTYLQFMVAAQGFYGAANVAGLPDCVCQPEPPQCQDLTVSADGWTPEPGGYGVWDDGLAGELFVGDGKYYWWWHLTPDTLTGEFSSVTLTFNEPVSYIRMDNNVPQLMGEYTGAPTTEITFNATTADPGTFPVQNEIAWHLRSVKPGAIGTVSSTLRLISVCVEPV